MSLEAEVQAYYRRARLSDREMRIILAAARAPARRRRLRGAVLGVAAVAAGLAGVWLLGGRVAPLVGTPAAVPPTGAAPAAALAANAEPGDNRDEEPALAVPQPSRAVAGAGSPSADGPQETEANAGSPQPAPEPRLGSAETEAPTGPGVERPSAAPAAARAGPAPVADTQARLTVTVTGSGDCLVSVAGTVIGIAPVVNVATPSGSQQVDLVCNAFLCSDTAPTLSRTVALEPGGSTVLVIETGIGCGWLPGIHLYSPTSDTGAWTDLADPDAPRRTSAPPWSARAYYHSGVRLLRRGLLPDAVTLFAACVAADADNALCYRALGITYARLDDGPKAYEWYKAYVDRFPNAPDANQVLQILDDYATREQQKTAGKKN